MTTTLAPAPIGARELQQHLRDAARCELLGVQTMELMVLRLDDPSVISTALAEVRRRAEALGLAWRLVSALSARPDLAAELGMSVDA